MKINILCLTLGLLICTVSNISAIAKYRAIPLDRLETSKNLKEGDIAFEYHVFNKADCKKYLGRNQVMDRGYQPIQISITNNSNQAFKLSLNNFSFPCVSYDEVAERVDFNTAGRIAGWGVGAFFIFPLIIPTIIEAVESPKANEMLYSDYSRKALKDQIIEPFSTISGIIFVASEQFKSDFSFALVNPVTMQRVRLSTFHKTVDIKDRSQASHVQEEDEEEEYEDEDDLVVPQRKVFAVIG